MSRRGRPALFPGHRTEVLQVVVRAEDKERLYATIPKSERPAWLRDAVASRLADDPITKEWLGEMGFETEPDYGDEISRYCINLQDRMEIVVEFGNYWSNGYQVKLYVQPNSVFSIEHIKTQSHLRQFCQLVIGKSIEECVRVRRTKAEAING